MLEALANTPLSDVQLREPVRMKADATLYDAVIMLRERKRGAVVVENGDGTLRGIFTERDLVTRVDHASDTWHRVTLKDSMTDEPESVTRDTPLAVVVQKMQAGGFRNLPLVDDDNRGIGLVSIRDVLKHLAEEFPQEFLNLPPDPAREAHEPWGG